MYFKTIKITGHQSGEIEKTIRRSALKSHTSLDLKFTSTYILDKEKCFLGYENDRKIDLSRISTPFEELLPKVIITFEKNDFTEYKVRLKIIPMLIFFMLSIFLLSTIFFSIKNNKPISNIYIISAVNLSFHLLAYIEYKLTIRKINNIINQDNKQSI